MKHRDNSSANLTKVASFGGISKMAQNSTRGGQTN